MNVREKLPIRRPNPTNSPKEGKWTEHKKDLQEDFNFHCGYCGSYDGYRHTWFEVDHFIPKSLFEPLGTLSNVKYINLVYSCKFCNNKKLAQWPSNDVDIPFINDKGFIDPCDKEYDNQLYRLKDGGIMWKTNLGKWMWETAFKFDERNHTIKLLWEVNQLRKIVLGYAQELAKMDKLSQEYEKTEKLAGEFSFKYVLIHDELMNHYNNL